MPERLRVRFDECSEKVSRVDELDSGRLTDDTLSIVLSLYTIVLYTGLELWCRRVRRWSHNVKHS